MICSVDECSREATRKGMCEMHYRRARRNGTPTLQAPNAVDHADGTRTCRGCGERKPLDEYDRHATARTGRRSWCRECRNEKRRDRYALDSGAVLDRKPSMASRESGTYA